jgi:hypothetical protein
VARTAPQWVWVGVHHLLADVATTPQGGVLHWDRKLAALCRESGITPQGVLSEEALVVTVRLCLSVADEFRIIPKDWASVVVPVSPEVEAQDRVGPLYRCDRRVKDLSCTPAEESIDF